MFSIFLGAFCEFCGEIIFWMTIIETDWMSFFDLDSVFLTSRVFIVLTIYVSNQKEFR